MAGRNKIRLWITGGCIAAGILLMLYPFVSNYLYERQQEEVIYGYGDTVAEMEEEEISEAMEAALQYNEELRDSRVVITDPFDPDAVRTETGLNYTELLNISGDGLMGYIEIPAISVFLPIYHGTSEQVLKDGVGHLENTSLPVGGDGSHAVLSAHSGLSDKKLFTDLELLELDDLFYIHVLDQTLAYKIDQIQVVTPDDTESLHIISGEDHITLVTCTPYGINSHRLLVRGTRTDYIPEEKAEQTVTDKNSPWMRQYLQAVLAGTLLLTLIFIAAILLGRRKKYEKE